MLAILQTAGLIALLLVPLLGLAIVVLVRGHNLTLDQAMRSEGGTIIKQRTRSPDQFPPGAIPVELALAVHDAWRAAGYHLTDDARVVVRLLSIAHRVMCEHQLSSLAPAVFNEGDRCPPAMVQCLAIPQWPCTFPDCPCVAIPLEFGPSVKKP